jgi:DNA modification methylase
MGLVLVDLSDVTPADFNPKKHNLKDLQKSITRFGFVEPIVIDSRTKKLVAGHGRVEALAALRATGANSPKGMSGWKIPVVEWESKSDTEAAAYLLASNKLTEKGGWNTDDLETLLASLHSEDALDGTGWSADDVLRMIGGEESEEDGSASEDKEKNDLGVAVGDLWLIGRHRVVCGDSTSADVVSLAMGEHSPTLMVTDPPYGVNYDPSWRDVVHVNPSGRKGLITNDDKSSWAEVYSLFGGRAAYVWHAALQSHVVHADLDSCGFKVRSQIIWSKNNLIIGRGDYHWQHEPCWYAVRDVKGDGKAWKGDRKQSTVWTADEKEDAPDEEQNHSTPKPVSLYIKAYLNSSNEGDAVYDPFLGSGTALIAAEKTNRTAICIELDPGYCSAAIKRIAKLVGEEPRRSSD